MIANIVQVSFWGDDENVPQSDYGDRCISL